MSVKPKANAVRGARAARIDVRGVQSAAEHRLANELMAKTQAPDYWDCMDWLETSGPRWPGYKQEHTRIAWLEGEMAGALRILTATIRIGKARFNMGGLGWVSTSAQFRKRGVCAALVNDSLAYMSGAGYSVSMLFGVPDLYHRYGYTCCIPEYASRVAVSEAPPAAPKGYSFTQFDTRYVRDIVRMTERRDANLACSFVRTAPYIGAQLSTASRTIPYWPDWPETFVLLDRRKRAAGYFTAQHGADEMHIKDICALDMPACEAVFHAAAARAAQKGLRALRFHVPPTDLFARYLASFNSVYETHHFRDRQGMMRFADVDEALRQMIPEWQALLDGAVSRCGDTELTLLVDGSAFRIDARGGKVSVERSKGRNRVVMNSQDLIRLCVGYFDPTEWLSTNARRLDNDAREMFTTLFPKRTQCVWPIDHF